jgi:uridine kinase
MTRTDHVAINDAHLPLARALLGLLQSRFALLSRPRTVIGVGGESGSGKSVTAAALSQLMSSTGWSNQVLHMDDYFVLPPRDNHEARVRDIAHVGPHEVDFDRIGQLVGAFHSGRDGVNAPLLDFPGNRFLTQHYHFSAARVLLIEGTYILGLPQLDTRIFLSATHEDAVERRRQRAREREDAFTQQVLDIEHALIAPYADTADIIVDRDFRIVHPVDA